MTTKDIHIIIVGASWYGDWARDVHFTLQKMGVSVEIVYTNSIADAAGGSSQSFRSKVFNLGKKIVRKASGRLFNRLKNVRAKAAAGEVMERVNNYPDKTKQIFVLCVWTPLEPHVLEALREKKVRCLLWQGEPPIDNARWAPSFDHCEHVFVIEEGYLEYFPAHVLPKVSILPLATNDSVHYSLEEVSPQFVSEVSFIGLYRHGRADILSVLQEFDIKIYGHGWEEGFESFPWLKKAYQGPLTAEQTNEVFNGAQISIGRLALGFTPEVGQTTNQRVFDISCANAFQLTQYIPSTEKFFGDAVVTFDSKESLHNLAKHYLDHQEERKILAKRAHAITLKNHTYRARIEEIFRIINITQ